MEINFDIRNEKPGDFREVENLTREAFWDLYKPGCDEHLALHKLRTRDCFIPELDFIAESENKIIGNIIYTKALIIDDQDNRHDVLCMGPISVLPEFQGKGVGTVLMRHSIGKAREMGFKGIVIFGNPAYYNRFGYDNADKYGITTKDGKNFEAFMVLELRDKSLTGISGKFFEDEAFFSQPAEIEEFEKLFPYKEKHKTDTQFG